VTSLEGDREHWGPGLLARESGQRQRSGEFNVDIVEAADSLTGMS
jgi:hypothetical protein